MKATLITALALSLSLVACSNSMRSSESVEGTISGKGVYQGTITPLDNPISRTTVLIYVDLGNSASKCTGSVLSPKVILTAAHCVSHVNEVTLKTRQLNPNQLYILDPETTSLLGLDAVIATGKKVIAHPKYLAQSYGDKSSHFSAGYDIALIELATPLPESYKPVNLSDNLNEITRNQMYIAGFGDFSLDKNTPDDFLLRHGPVTVDLAKNQVKVANSAPDSLITQFYTNSPIAPNLSFTKASNESSVCHGDSGGPIYYVKNGKIFLAGVNVAMSFINSTNSPSANCLSENEGSEISVSMAGPTLGFVLETYKQLTGGSLPLNRDTAEKDPRTFEYYLNNPVMNSKNSVINLEGYSFKRNADNKNVLLITSQPAQLPDMFIAFEPAISESSLDGRTILNVVLISKDGQMMSYIEGRAKLNGDKVKLVILTGEGYLSAELPMLPNAASTK